MSHEASSLPAQPVLRSFAMSEPPVAGADDTHDQLPLWTATRIDMARRLWTKGVAEPEILAALNRLSGAPHTNPQPLIALARRLCWPRPQQKAPVLRLTTRDGWPSQAERQALELALVHDVVELPLEDAVAWGRANGVVRQAGERDAELIGRINQARAGWNVPQFRVTRSLPAAAPPSPPPAPPPAPARTRGRRRAV